MNTQVITAPGGTLSPAMFDAKFAAFSGPSFKTFEQLVILLLGRPNAGKSSLITQIEDSVTLNFDLSKAPVRTAIPSAVQFNFAAIAPPQWWSTVMSFVEAMEMRGQPNCPAWVPRVKTVTIDTLSSFAMVATDEVLRVWLRNSESSSWRETNPNTTPQIKFIGTKGDGYGRVYGLVELVLRRLARCGVGVVVCDYLIDNVTENAKGEKVRTEELSIPNGMMPFFRTACDLILCMRTEVTQDWAEGDRIPMKTPTGEPVVDAISKLPRYTTRPGAKPITTPVRVLTTDYDIGYSTADQVNPKFRVPMPPKITLKSGPDRQPAPGNWSLVRDAYNTAVRAIQHPAPQGGATG